MRCFSLQHCWQRSHGEFPTIALGDSDQLRVGEDVLAIGNPLGLDQSVTREIVSRLDRFLPEAPFARQEPWIQTDTPKRWPCPASLSEQLVSHLRARHSDSYVCICSNPLTTWLAYYPQSMWAQVYKTCRLGMIRTLGLSPLGMVFMGMAL